MSKNIDIIEETTEHIVGQAGVGLIGLLLNQSQVDNIFASSNNEDQFKDKEIIRSCCGLLAQGKADYAHIEDFREDDFFSHALNISKAPSSSTYRQRMDKLGKKSSEITPELLRSSRILWSKNDMEPEYISLEGDTRVWTRLDIDVSPWHNEGSHKEETNYTYDGSWGYAPIFSHLGGGFIVNAELRPGQYHSLHEGTHDFIHQSSEYARKMVPQGTRILTILDCGFDDSKLISQFFQDDRQFWNDFIIKHNLRQEPKQSWLKLAQQEGECILSDSKKSVYRGTTWRNIDGLEHQVRMVYEIVEVKQKKGQVLLVPEIYVYTFFTSLDLSEAKVIQLYRDRGTSEQYHSELKTELDLEQLASGNFTTNQLFFQLGVLVYNMLRIIGKEMVEDKSLPFKKATRRRIKTIVQNIIYLACKFVKTGRKIKLRLSCPKHWYNFYYNIFYKLKCST